jgi:hypothetical protein
MNTKLLAIFQEALSERGFIFRFVRQERIKSKLIVGMQAFYFENDAHTLELGLTFGDQARSFSVFIQELATGKRQTFGFYAKLGEDLKTVVDDALNSSPDLLAIIRGEKPPNNLIDWDDYK